MSKTTKIQWCDSTDNPVMGCGGCELFPAPGVILSAVDRALHSAGYDWEKGQARRVFTDLIQDAWESLRDDGHEPGPGHVNGVTTTNIYHLRKRFQSVVSDQFGRQAGKLVRQVIESHNKCYAAQLHLNRTFNLLKPERKVKKGYAPSFEQVTQFDGRMKEAAGWSDLYGTDRDGQPWLNGLPRLIFVSDMGDAFSRGVGSSFLEKQYAETQTDQGRRHIWLWLTKRPDQMKLFSERVGGFGDNICAMTSVTSTKTLHRIDALREVDCHMRGLSIEPLSTALPRDLDLTGIDWVIVGGESGAMANVAPFRIAWAEDLRRLCLEQNVAFFLKQLGRQPTRNGEPIMLKDGHGGDWSEWSPELRIRKFPPGFYDYRRGDSA